MPKANHNVMQDALEENLIQAFKTADAVKKSSFYPYSERSDHNRPDALYARSIHDSVLDELTPTNSVSPSEEISRANCMQVSALLNEDSSTSGRTKSKQQQEIRRQQNREAARRARMRQKERLEDLEENVVSLKREIVRLKKENAELKRRIGE